MRDKIHTRIRPVQKAFSVCYVKDASEAKTEQRSQRKKPGSKDGRGFEMPKKKKGNKGRRRSRKSRQWAFWPPDDLIILVFGFYFGWLRKIRDES